MKRFEDEDMKDYPLRLPLTQGERQGASFPKTKAVPAPPLFIEEVAAELTEEFIPLYLRTPSPLRGTPSINRGRAELLFRFGSLFNHSI